MPRTYMKTSDEKFTSGFPVESLRRLTWADFLRYDWTRKGMLAKDMDRRDVRAEVRLKPEAFARLQKRLKQPGASITVDLPDEMRITVTSEWQQFKATTVVDLWVASLEDTTLGGPYAEMVAMDDGHGGKFYNAQHRPGETIFEFRFAGDTALVGATS